MSVIASCDHGSAHDRISAKKLRPATVTAPVLAGMLDLTVSGASRSTPLQEHTGGGKLPHKDLLGARPTGGTIWPVGLMPSSEDRVSDPGEATIAMAPTR